MRFNHFWMALTLATTAPLGAAPALEKLKTEAEKTDWKRTGRYSEVERLCEEFPKHFPKQVVCQKFGTTPEGRPMLSLVIGDTKKRDRPVILFQGGIHAGEIDGKDAGFLFIREVLEGKRLPGILQKATLVFVPVFNVDGHERFGKNNRPNQVGPEEMGWRTTAQNYNLNRDYLKADAPEMRAMHELLNRWDPLVYVDLHVTDGAQFQHDIAVMVEPTLAGPEPLKTAGVALRDQIMIDLAQFGHKPLWFYPSFEEDDDPTSGIAARPQPPRFSNGYWGLRNRFGILVETHSWRDYAHRCRATVASLDSIVKATAANGKAWRAAAEAADREMSQLAGKTAILSYKNSDKVENFDFLGYRYVRRDSPVSGQLMTVYDPTQPEVWKMPLKKEVVPGQQVAAPASGYVVPVAYRNLVEPRLKSHALQYQVLNQSQDVTASVYQITDVKLASSSYESHQRAEYKGKWSQAQEKINAGSLWVPIAQPGAILLMQLLEPESPDSFLTWGYMNEVFERKEYMEPYVAESVAQEMLKDPAVKQEFEKKLADDPAFAKSPQARLDFFYRRHPSYDERMNRYPILRLETGPQILTSKVK
ncbi:MAG TPA: M14 family metallopeptidase [Oligoflexus sp.]|uniref:M14 family metallopeptidase n=1 Tax=Oligoflexus sp. TaxID=1971216 RepID=UPI002D7457FC|nr:M14 family metallopeptidase [Oligoflexus sp.]HYX38204.1 M14 family metallopeptidase [Oligoflexus sp.]